MISLREIDMPLYDIHCDDCNWKWEHLMKFSDIDPCCPECGSAFTKRMRSAPPEYGIGEGLPTERRHLTIPSNPTKVWMGGKK